MLSVVFRKKKESVGYFKLRETYYEEQINYHEKLYQSSDRKCTS